MKFYQLPNSNSFTHHLLFLSREATSENYGTRVSFSYYLPLRSILFALLFSNLLNPKIQKYLAVIYFIWRSIYQYLQLSHVCLPISGTVTRKGLTTPLTRRIASSCYLCVGSVYVVLLGSPTGSITLVSSLREIPTFDVLHHPFLFGEIPM